MILGFLRQKEVSGKDFDSNVYEFTGAREVTSKDVVEALEGAEQVPDSNYSDCQSSRSES